MSTEQQRYSTSYQMDGIRENARARGYAIDRSTRGAEPGS